MRIIIFKVNVVFAPIRILSDETSILQVNFLVDTFSEELRQLFWWLAVKLVEI